MASLFLPAERLSDLRSANSALSRRGCVSPNRRKGVQNLPEPVSFQTQMGKLVATGGGTGAWANPDTAIEVTGFNPPTMTVPGACAVNCNNNDECYAFHPAGAHVLLCDGSVRLLRAGTDINLFIPLVTRAVGEVLSPNLY